jgi:glycosyltransferase involved in cell wall biosynthesis
LNRGSGKIIYMTYPSSSSQINHTIILIPAHNEAANIERVVRAAAKYLPVWVIDDGSTDGTAYLAEAAGAVVLRQNPNQGKGSALRLGFTRVIEAGLEGAITLDGDGQHDPEEIANFLAALDQGPADLIIGSRDFKGMPLVRRLSNTFGRITYSAVLGRKVQDNQSGYRYISRRLMQEALQSTQPGFEFEVEMISMCVKKSGYIFKEISIKTIYYEDGKSHIRPWKHVKGFFRLLWRTASFRNGQ